MCGKTYAAGGTIAFLLLSKLVLVHGDEFPSESAPVPSTATESLVVAEDHIRTRDARVVASDSAVQISAIVQTAPPQVGLNWPSSTEPTSYKVYRRNMGDLKWQNPTPLPSMATCYIDKDVKVGAAYEYMVWCLGNGYNGFGFALVGVQAPLVDVRGKVILVVDDSVATDLSKELARLQEDFIGDGWGVIRHDVSRTETVPNIKSLITNDFNSDPTHVKAVFLFGHIPVPYSGNTPFDGHSGHQGAWPADVYYADMTGVWTDTTVNNSSADRPENRNIPGDGKFDQSIVPGTVALQIGRVDLSNMPTFQKSEIELLRQYLNKDHNYRHKLFVAEPRGLIDDNFGIYADSPSASGWRNFATFFGPARIHERDFFTELNSKSYLWAYGCGPGDYQMAAGIGFTSNFAAGRPRVVFTMLFGSLFGDWDYSDSFLRAPLAADGYGLSCSWSGRPQSIYHPMALGETIGECTRLTQNYDGKQYPGGGAYMRGIEIALMGDPTLRLHTVASPTCLTAVNDAAWKLSWNASADSAIGYHVYRSNSQSGPFTRLTAAPITATSYSDPGVGNNVYTYQVRAVKLECAASGSYYNASQGIFFNATPKRNP